MRAPIFFILRGAPASGKSTWVEENGLVENSVSADEWRIRLFGIEVGEDGKERIPQRDQGRVWGNVARDIEARMEAREDIVLDACSLKARDMSKYVDGCIEHGYVAYAVEFFRDVTKETCHERNAAREEYKQVPDHVIDNFYDKVDSIIVPFFYKTVTPQEASEIIYEAREENECSDGNRQAQGR